MSQTSDSPYTEPTQPLPPPAPPSSTNGLGIAGFVTSLVAICTFFLLSPIALLLSLIALLRPPRGFAIAGTVLGGIGTVLLVGAFVAILSAASAAGVALNHVGGFFNTMVNIPNATVAIQNHHQQHDALPDDSEGNDLIDGIIDGWGTQLRYERLGEQRYQIISAGPDQQFGTDDDIEFPAVIDGTGPAGPIPPFTPTPDAPAGNDT